MSEHGRILEQTIRDFRRRRTGLLVLRGLALSLGLLATLLLVTGLVAWQFRGQEWMVPWLRFLTVGGVGLAVYLTLWRPLRRRVSDRQIARYLEERTEGLSEALVTAVEFIGQREEAGSSPALIGRLLRTADREAGQIDLQGIIRTSHFWRWGAVTLTALALFTGMTIFGPREVRQGVAQIIAPSSAAAAGLGLRIEVSPGTARVVRGRDLRIVARLINFQSDEVLLQTRFVGESEEDWVEQPMEPTRQADRFEAFLFNPQRPIEYFVESSGCRSEIFRLTIVDLPFVRQIDQEHTYPAYTGLPTRTF